MDRKCSASAAFLLAAHLSLSTLMVAPPGAGAGEPQEDDVIGEEPDRAELPIEADDGETEVAEPEAAPDYVVRVVYAIPANRSPQPDGVARLEDYFETVQRWFADQMELQGYGRKTIAFETEPDGDDLLVHVVRLEHPDTSYHGDYGQRWGNVLGELSRTGVPLWAHGTLTLVIAEMQVQEQDGTFRESSTFVGGAGGGPFSGVGMVSGDFLARLSEDLLTDDRAYGGLTLPDIGPFPLVQGLTFPSFEGATVSSTSSSAYGAVLHELSHGFGLPHDFRNDRNFNGNLMGNGLRGMRGALFPERYPDDDTRLATGSALLLNHSRFFNRESRFGEDEPPRVEILSTGTVTPRRGLCGVEFTASDAGSGLAGALLIRAGNVVADMPLSGTSFSGRILAYDYVPGIDETWEVMVLDRDGNRASSGTRLTCETGRNRAPYPFVRVSATQIDVDDVVVLDAGGSFDPDGGSSQLSVEWDVDGDGEFDTHPSVDRLHRVAYAMPGLYRVTARLTDESGDAALSMPIGLRVGDSAPSIDVDIDISPKDETNKVKLEPGKSLLVAILSGGEFDALQIDAATVRFGPAGAQAVADWVADVDRDGSTDRVVEVKVNRTGIACGDEHATLTARSFSGQNVTGTDPVRVVPCDGRRK